MSELLRMAKELVAARERATDGCWIAEDYSIYTDAVGGDYIIGGKHASEMDIEFITLAANHTPDVIKGYQDLLRQIIEIYDARDAGRHRWTIVELHPVIEDARDSIPRAEGE